MCGSVLQSGNIINESERINYIIVGTSVKEMIFDRIRDNCSVRSFCFEQSTASKFRLVMKFSVSVRVKELTEISRIIQTIYRKLFRDQHQKLFFRENA